MKKIPDLIAPTPEENAQINAAIASDPDTRDLGDVDEDQFMTFDEFRKAYNMEWWNGKVEVVCRGRPVKATPRQSIHIRLEPEVINAFKATGKGWQTRINDVLADWVKHNHPAC